MTAEKIKKLAEMQFDQMLFQLEGLDPSLRKQIMARVFSHIRDAGKLILPDNGLPADPPPRPAPRLQSPGAG